MIDSVIFNGNGILTIQFNSTALGAGQNSALLTVNNSIVTNLSMVNALVTSYSGVPPVYNNSLTNFYGLPTTLILNVINGSFGILIINNGYSNMNATDTFQININIF